MLEGHQAPLVLSHHAPGYYQAISTSRKEMPLVKEQALHGSLVPSESLQEKMPLFSGPLQLRLWLLQRPELEALDESQHHTPPICDCYPLGMSLSWLYFCFKKAREIPPSPLQSPLPSSGRIWSGRGLVPGGSVPSCWSIRWSQKSLSFAVRRKKDKVFLGSSLPGPRGNRRPPCTWCWVSATMTKLVLKTRKSNQPPFTVILCSWRKWHLATTQCGQGVQIQQEPVLWTFIMVWMRPMECMYWKLNPQSHMFMVSGGRTFGRWL